MSQFQQSVQSRCIQKDASGDESNRSNGNAHVGTGRVIHGSPILEQVSSQLIDLFGYCIAPINYGGKRSVLDESCRVESGPFTVASGLKELILVSILSKPEVKEAVALINLFEE